MITSIYQSNNKLKVSFYGFTLNPTRKREFIESKGSCFAHPEFSTYHTWWAVESSFIWWTNWYRSSGWNSATKTFLTSISLTMRARAHISTRFCVLLRFRTWVLKLGVLKSSQGGREHGSGMLLKSSMMENEPSFCFFSLAARLGETREKV